MVLESFFNIYLIHILCYLLCFRTIFKIYLDYFKLLWKLKYGY
jgi:hypothetical protein